MKVQQQPAGGRAERSGGGVGAQQACQAQATLSHDPERQVAVSVARARGGAAASKLRALEGRRAKLETPAALVRFTGKLIQDVLDETTPVDIGRAVLYGISIQRELVESGDLEKRLSAVDARLEGKGSKRWSA